MNHKELRARTNAALKADLLHTMIPPKPGSIRGLSSGSVALNRALSGSVSVGYPWGRVVEIFGPEGSGKSTLAMHAVLEAQRLEARIKKPVPALYIDLEHALALDYMGKIGVCVEDVDFAYPDYGEQAFEVILAAIVSGYRLIVVDSVDAMVPKAEVEGKMTSSHVGELPRMMGKGLRKLCGAGGALGNRDCAVLFINQIRMKVGVMFGNPETTSGGFALKFYSTQRIEVRSPAGGKITTGQSFSDGDDDAPEVGRTTNCRVVKNKVFPPYRKASFDIRYGLGIDRASDLVAVLKDMGVTTYKGMGLKAVEKAIREGQLDASALTAELAASERERKKAAVK
jgi:recombination protein RecA